MPHNNADATMSRQRAAMPAPEAALMAPYQGSMLPLQVQQGAPMFHHHHGTPGGAIFTVYVPSHHSPSSPTAIHMVPNSSFYEGQQHLSMTAPPPPPPPRASVAHSSDDETTATSNKQDNRSSSTGSFDSHQEGVVLMEAGNQDKRKLPESPTSNEEDNKVPFKKRKMVSQILRTNGESSFHVSPVSHGSKTTGVPTTLSPDRSQASHGSSYEDIKGGQALHETSKIAEDKSIVAPPKTVTVRHFPSQLFELLTNPTEGVEGVLQWTPNGKAWRIVRWDALRKSVLPKYFGGASVDSFLSEISTWGFAEVSYGNDAGAYAHTLFRRGFPNLCKEIQSLSQIQQTRRGSNTALSILKVPSLGDAANSEEGSKAPSSPSGSTDTSKGSSAQTGMWTLSQQSSVYIPYRQEDHFFEAQQSQAQTTWMSAVPYETSAPSLPAYSPVRIRSGRGGARLPVHVPVQVTPNASRRSVPRSNFARVISNRGRRTSSSIVAPPMLYSMSSPSIAPSPLRSALKPTRQESPAVPDSPVSSTEVPQPAPASPVDSSETSSSANATP